MTVRLLALAICLCSARVGNAAIIVTFDSTSITANQIGFVDVWIESSDGSDFLAGFDAYFRLSGPTANGNLSFAPVPSQPNSQTLPNYVFFGHPDIVPINYGATPLSSNEIRLTDFLLNFANQKELLSTRWLLARIASFTRRQPRLCPTATLTRSKCSLKALTVRTTLPFLTKTSIYRSTAFQRQVQSE